MLTFVQADLDCNTVWSTEKGKVRGYRYSFLVHCKTVCLFLFSMRKGNALHAVYIGMFLDDMTRQKVKLCVVYAEQRTNCLLWYFYKLKSSVVN